MPTRKSIIWLLAAAALYFIAWNIGGGWLYTIIAILIAFPLGSLIISRFNTGSISLTQECPDRCSQGDELSTTITIRNRSRLPRFLLDITGSLGGSDASLLLAHAGGASSREIPLVFSNVRRGIYTGGGFTLSSRAPAGLARSRRGFMTDCPLVVYPRWRQLAGDWGSGDAGSGHAGAGAAPARAASGDYLGVREYRPGDSPRSIHWKTTARSNRLTVTEYARPVTMVPVFIVDPFRQGEIGEGDDSSFETAVSLAASLVQREALHRRDFGIGASWEEAAARGLDSDPEAAMLFLAGLRAESREPLGLDTAGTGWADATPVVIMTSHTAYATVDESDLVADYPQSMILMIDGRACGPDYRQRGLLLDDSRIDRLAGRLDATGCRFLLIDPDEDLERCLEGL
ncbi:MAG: DUF58 domain-containing protein [Gaiellales bacterium]|nr:MAG: DUF58 domain-containing protein [Gaiellales bacterium]